MEAEKFVNTLKCTNDVAERGNMIIRMPASARPVCYITRGTQSPDGLSWWLEVVGMVVREDTSLPCKVTRLHWEARVSVQCPQ